MARPRELAGLGLLGHRRPLPWWFPADSLGRSERSEPTAVRVPVVPGLLRSDGHALPHERQKRIVEGKAVEVPDRGLLLAPEGASRWAGGRDWRLGVRRSWPWRLAVTSRDVGLQIRVCECALARSDMFGPLRVALGEQLFDGQAETSGLHVYV